MNQTSHDPSHPGAGRPNSDPHAGSAAGTSIAEGVDAAEIAADTGENLAGHAPGPESHPATDLVSSPGADPLLPPTSGGGPAGPGGPPAPVTGTRPRRRLLVAGIAAVVVVLTVAIGLRGGGDDDPGAEIAGESIGEASAGSDDLPDNAGRVQTDDDSDGLFVTGTPEVEVVDQGYSSFDGGQGIEGSWAVVVENSGDGSARLLNVTVEFKDATGAVIANETQMIKHVPAGEQMGVAHEFIAGDLPALIDSMDVTLGEPSTLNGTDDDGAYTISGVTLAPAGGLLGGWRAVFTIDSSYESTVTNADLYAVFRDANGKIVGGAFTVFSTITPGTSAGEITSYAETPGVVTADIYLTGGMGGPG